MNLTRADEPATELVNIVGPICESADVLGHDRLLPATREGDVLLIANAGAYGHVMSSRLQPARAGGGAVHLKRIAAAPSGRRRWSLARRCSTCCTSITW